MVQRLKSKMPPRRFTRAAAENWELDSEGEDCEIDEQQAAELEGEAVNGCPHGTDHESQLAAAADSDPAFQAATQTAGAALGKGPKSARGLARRPKTLQQRR